MQPTNRNNKAHQVLTVTPNKFLNNQLYTMHAGALKLGTHYPCSRAVFTGNVYELK